LYTGATPILVDIVLDIPSTVFAMSIEEIKRKKTSKTKAIIFTHMFGKASDIEPLLKLGIPIIEDGTLSLGGSCNKVSVGEKGTISVFSLHETKVISAISGAVLVTDSNVILGRINNYLENSNHGKEFSLRYNYTLPPLHAALALNQLDKLDRFIDERKGLSIYYSDRLGCMSNQIITPTISEDNIFFRYILGIPQHIKPEELLKYCLTKGIELGRGIYPPLHQFLQLSGEQFTQTEEAVRSVVSIPVHPSISWSDAEYMMDCVIDYMTMCRAG
jgi:perosamine synthetase